MTTINWAKELDISVSCFTSMGNIKYVNKRAGYYFFSKDTLKFFNSKISEDVYATWKEDCYQFYFVTSEEGPDNIRRYTVREFDSQTGKVATVGEFQQYKTSADAERAAKALVK